MIYGAPPLNIEVDITDRIGIRTLVLSKFWQPSRWPMGDAELQDEKPGIPVVGGGMLLVGDETRKAAGGRKTFWTFEGIHGDGKSVTFKDRKNSLDYSFQAGFEQLDIRKHPQIQKLVELYGGVLDPSSLEIIWPISVGTGNGSVGLGKGKAREVQNPMYGRNDFLQPTGTYSFRYASFDPPTNDGANKVHKGGLPGRPPRAPGCDWLEAPASFVRRGIVFDITEIFLLSGPTGWPAPIYTFLLPTNGQGLTTGRLTTGTL